MPEALKVIGDEKALLPANRDQRLHDAIATRIALIFKGLPIVSDIYLDQEIPRIYPLMERTPDVLIEGIKTKLFVLDEETQVFSGHGNPTTIGFEKQYNPFLK